MKFLFLLPLLCTTCTPPDSAVSSGQTTYQMGQEEKLIIKTVIIEGNPYLAYYLGNSYWGLCPKLQPVKEGTPMPTPPEAPYKP